MAILIPFKLKLTAMLSSSVIPALSIPLPSTNVKPQVGPTIACVIAEQFQVALEADRCSRHFGQNLHHQCLGSLLMCDQIAIAHLSLPLSIVAQ